VFDLLEKLPAGSRVLDLGAGGGSFRSVPAGVTVVRLDLTVPTSRPPGDYVRADAARLPFGPGAFDLIVSNHSLEHLPELEQSLREAARVLKPSAILYIAVPDASTLADRIYRWLGRGGGHVNPFRSAGEVISLIERLTGRHHRATRTLYTSLCFLNARNFTARPPRRILLFANGNERFLVALNLLLRLLDRTFGSRLSVYGWSFYFGDVDLSPELEPWINVCVRCGSGHSEAFLCKTGSLRAAPGIFDRYLCPDCGAPNRFTPPEPSPCDCRSSK
jgi:SAM-dependent methyltransferase